MTLQVTSHSSPLGQQSKRILPRKRILFSILDPYSLCFTLCMAAAVTSTSATQDFPPILDADDIAYFSENHDIDGLHWALSNVFQRSQRNPNDNEVVHDLPSILVSRGGGSTYSTAYKLKMDLEQAEYLAENLQDKDKATFFKDQVVPVYEKVLENVPPLKSLERTAGLYAFRKSDADAGISRFYNKALHLTDYDELKDEKGNIMPLLNEKFDAKKIERQWFGEEDNSGGELCSDTDNESTKLSRPGVVIIDDILSQAALDRIRQLLLESTVWYQTKMPLKFGGYVGAYIDDGLHDRILLQLAFELNKALPRIMTGHPLKYLWAYKYDSEYTGINTHADQAAVNVNLWITPDDANLDKDSGGLVVFTAKPPKDWDFAKYNTDAARVMKEIIEPTNYQNVTVPFKENRAVVFDSALFHHTDKFQFKDGYKNRRINLTILYGDMQLSEDQQRNDGVSSGVRDDL